MNHIEIMQKVFDKAVSSVYNQGCKSVDFDKNACSYRDIEGNKCAIGHLISDDDMKEYSIGNNDAVRSFKPEVIKKLLPEIPLYIGYEFLADLQRAHDNSPIYYFKDNFLSNADLMAYKYGLKKFVPES